MRAAIVVTAAAVLVAGLAGGPQNTSAAQNSTTGNTDFETREVWVRPIFTGGTPVVNNSDIKSAFQQALDHFETWSGGTLQARVTAVDKAVITPPHTCDGALTTGGHFREVGGKMAPETVHVATAVYGPCWDRSVAPAGIGNWFLIAGLAENKPFPQRTVIHEFGHNLGLSHANGWSCYAQSMTPKAAEHLGSGNCTEVEYGDSTSIMGSGRLDSGDDDLGAAALTQLGWIGPDRYVTVKPGEHLYKLPSYNERENGTRLILPGGYALSYRPADSSYSFVEGGGVFLHDIDLPHGLPSGGYHPRATSMLIPMTPFLDGAQDGMHIVLPESEVMFYVEDIAPDSATIRVVTDEEGDIRDKWGPAVLSPYKIGRPPALTLAKCTKAAWRVRYTWAAYDPAGIASGEVEIAGRTHRLRIPDNHDMYPGYEDFRVASRPGKTTAVVRMTDTLGNVSETSLRVRVTRKCG